MEVISNIFTEQSSEQLHHKNKEKKKKREESGWIENRTQDLIDTSMM